MDEDDRLKIAGESDDEIAEDESSTEVVDIDSAAESVGLGQDEEAELHGDRKVEKPEQD